MNKLTQKIIDELNRQYGCSFFTFSEKGLTIKFSDELKEFFDEYDIKSEMDFDNHFGSFRDFLCIPKGMDMVSFCFDNETPKYGQPLSVETETAIRQIIAEVFPTAGNLEIDAVSAGDIIHNSLEEEIEYINKPSYHISFHF